MCTQLGILLEFIGYWFSAPLLLGRRGLEKLEGYIEQALQRFPWLAIVYVNFIVAHSVYDWVVAEDLFETPAVLPILLAPGVVVVVFSLLVGRKLVRDLNRLMFHRELFSTQDIRDLLGEIWDTSLKEYVLTWLIVCGGGAFFAVMLGWLAYCLLVDSISAADHDLVSCIASLFVSEYIMMVYVFGRFLILVAFGYGIVTGLTLLLKRLLIDLADDTAIHRRAIWWNVLLSELGLYLQRQTTGSTVERLGITAEMIAVGFLLPVSLEQARGGLVMGSIQIGHIVFFIGTMLQFWSPVNWVVRISVLLESASLIIALPADFGRYAFDKEKARPVAQRAAVVFTVSTILQLVAAFLPP